MEGVIMGTVSGAHQELITCDGGKRQFQFVSVYRSFVSVRIRRNLFISPHWHIYPGSRTPCPQLWILSNRCQMQEAVFSSIFSSYLASFRELWAMKDSCLWRGLSLSLSLSLTVQEESLRMFYFFLSLCERSSYQTCHFWVIQMLAVKPVRFGWLVCIYEYMSLWIRHSSVFHGTLCWTLSFISGVVWKINAVAIQCLLLVFHCYSEDFTKQKYCLRKCFLKGLKCYCWQLIEFSAINQSYPVICLPRCSTAALK